MTDKTPQPLNPFDLNLPQVSLVEASAGSGKTYNIVNLYLRLLLNLGAEGKGLSRCLQAREILVVTFTNAATSEMKQRIEDKLYQFLAYLKDLESLLKAEIAQLPAEQQSRWKQEQQRICETQELKHQAALAKLKEQPEQPSPYIALDTQDLADQISENFHQFLEKASIDAALEKIMAKFAIKDEFYLNCLKTVIAQGRVGSCIKYLEKELTNNEFAVTTIDGFCKASLNNFDFLSPVSSYKFENKREVFLKQALRKILSATLKNHSRYNSKELSKHIPLFNLPAAFQSKGSEPKSAYHSNGNKNNIDKSYLVIEENLILNSFNEKTEHNQSLPDSILTFVGKLIDLYSIDEVNLLAARYGIESSLTVEQLLAEQQNIFAQWENQEEPVTPTEITEYDPAQQIVLSSGDTLNFAQIVAEIKQAAAGNQNAENFLKQIIQEFPLITFEQSILQSLSQTEKLAWVKNSKLYQLGFKPEQIEQVSESDFRLEKNIIDEIAQENPADTDNLVKARSLGFMSFIYRQWLLFFSQRIYQEFLEIQEFERSAYFYTLQSELLRLIEQEDKSVRQQIQQQYKYAIIDEFQDTSPTQFKIFSKLFIPESSPTQTNNLASATAEQAESQPQTAEKLNGFIMIGDPKQAIYEFRGADIFSYFTARDRADEIFTIQNNYRSSPSFIQSSNQLFASQRGGFHLPEIQYPIALPGQKDKVGIELDGKEISPITLINLESFQEAVKELKEKLSASEAMAWIISILIKLGKSGRLTLGGKPLKASDICILERSGKELKEAEQALRKFNLNVNAKIGIELSQSKADPLFKAFINFLHAVNDPTNTGELNKYLCSQLSGLTLGQAQEAILNKDNLEKYTRKLANYRQIWQEKGLLSLLQQLVLDNQLLAQTQVAVAGNKSADSASKAEAATQAEGAAGAADNKAKESSEQKVTIPLLGQIQDLFNVVDYVVENFPRCNSPLETLNFIAQLKHLERQEEENGISKSSIEDQDAVNLMTNHKSKGLEFGLVFTSTLAVRGLKKNKNADLQLLNITDTLPGLTDFYDLTSAADYSFYQDLRLAERARLFYVVITRAKYGVVSFFNDNFVKDFIEDNNHKEYYLGNAKFLTHHYQDKEASLSPQAKFALDNRLFPITYREYLGEQEVSMKQGRSLAHFLPEFFNKYFFKTPEAPPKKKSKNQTDEDFTNERNLWKEKIVEDQQAYLNLVEKFSQPNFYTYDYASEVEQEAENNKIRLSPEAKLTPQEFSDYLKAQQGWANLQDLSDLAEASLTPLNKVTYLATNPMISNTSLFSLVEDIIKGQAEIALSPNKPEPELAPDAQLANSESGVQATVASVEENNSETEAKMLALSKGQLRQLLASLAQSKAIASSMSELPPTEVDSKAKARAEQEKSHSRSSSVTLSWQVYTNLKTPQEYQSLVETMHEASKDSVALANSSDLDTLDLTLNIAYQFSGDVRKTFTENSSFSKIHSDKAVTEIISNLDSLDSLFSPEIRERISELQQKISADSGSQSILAGVSSLSSAPEEKTSLASDHDYESEKENNDSIIIAEEEVLDGEALESTDNSSEDSAEEIETSLEDYDLNTILGMLPSGAEFGDEVHKFLEKYSSKQNSDDKEKEKEFKQALRKSFLRYGEIPRRATLRLISDSLQYPILNLENLSQIKSTRLDPEPEKLIPHGAIQEEYLKLANSQVKRINEWKFNIDMSNNLAGIQRFLELLQQAKILPPGDLSKLARNLQVTGKFTGAVDLIMFGQQEVVIIDYKTNNLGNNVDNYHPHLLCLEMIKTGYILQLYFYLTAVYSFVKSQYQQANQPELLAQLKFVGVYLFLRGMLCKPNKEYSANGKFIEIPSLELLEQLSQALLPENK